MINQLPGGDIGKPGVPILQGTDVHLMYSVDELLFESGIYMIVELPKPEILLVCAKESLNLGGCGGAGDNRDCTRVERRDENDSRKRGVDCGRHCEGEVSEESTTAFGVDGGGIGVEKANKARDGFIRRQSVDRRDCRVRKTFNYGVNGRDGRHDGGCGWVTNPY
jgi:hypothetical protein